MIGISTDRRLVGDAPRERDIRVAGNRQLRIGALEMKRSAGDDAAAAEGQRCHIIGDVPNRAGASAEFERAPLDQCGPAVAVVAGKDLGAPARLGERHRATSVGDHSGIRLGPGLGIQGQSCHAAVSRNQGRRKIHAASQSAQSWRGIPSHVKTPVH